DAPPPPRFSAPTPSAASSTTSSRNSTSGPPRSSAASTTPSWQRANPRSTSSPARRGKRKAREGAERAADTRSGDERIHSRGTEGESQRPGLRRTIVPFGPTAQPAPSLPKETALSGV